MEEDHNTPGNEVSSGPSTGESSQVTAGGSEQAAPGSGTESQQQNAQSDDQSKVFAIIGYIIPILFFLPLVTDAKNDPFARYHANQQLILLLFWVIGQVASTVLAFVLIGFLLMPIVIIAGLIFMVMGIIHAANGEQKPMPLIGGFTLIS